MRLITARRPITETRQSGPRRRNNDRKSLIKPVAFPASMDLKLSRGGYSLDSGNHNL